MDVCCVKTSAQSGVTPFQRSQKHKEKNNPNKYEALNCLFCYMRLWVYRELLKVGQQFLCFVMEFVDREIIIAAVLFFNLTFSHSCCVYINFLLCVFFQPTTNCFFPQPNTLISILNRSTMILNTANPEYSFRCMQGKTKGLKSISCLENITSIFFFLIT